MTESKEDPVETLRISKELEITVGKEVNVLEHPDCAGRYGTIVEINFQERTYRATCDSCYRNVIVDTKTLIKEKF